MNPLHVLYPVFALATLTFFITIRLAILRKRAVLQDGLKASYFRYNQGGEPPEYVLRNEQHYTNLYEQPVLFYAICLIGYVTAGVNPLTVALAWLYVASRLVHSYIHLRLNKLLKRRKAFIFCTATLITLWVVMFVQLVTR